MQEFHHDHCLRGVACLCYFEEYVTQKLKPINKNDIKELALEVHYHFTTLARN